MNIFSCVQSWPARLQLCKRPRRSSNGEPGHSPSTPDQWKAKFHEKTLVASAVAIPFTASIILLVSTVMGYKSTSSIVPFILNNRASSQIIVSVMASLLAWLNVYTVTKLIAAATRIHLLRHSISLNKLRLLEAIAGGKIGSSLPRAMYTTSLILVLLFAIPNYLWTGTMTPVFTESTRSGSNVLKVPQYTTSSSDIWSNNGKLGSKNQPCSTIINRVGVFSACAASNLQSSLLKGASQATSNFGQLHPKNDNSQYFFIGRSFGVGSSVGLVDETLVKAHASTRLLRYNYIEEGYISNVTCAYNTSTDFHLQPAADGDSGSGIPGVYYVIGSFPDAPYKSSPDFYSVPANSDQQIAAMISKTYGNHSIVGLVAGSDYVALNASQCEIDFIRKSFNVSVDVVNKVISVLPISSTSDNSSSLALDPTYGLKQTITNQINGISMISTSLYSSIVGDAFMANLAAHSFDTPSNQVNISADTSQIYSNSTANAAIADSVASIADDLLVYIGSSQFFIPNDGAGEFTLVDVELTIEAVKFGESQYAFITFGLCSLLLLAVVAEALRTRGWRLLPKWDFTDMASIVISSAVAGQDLVNDLCRNQGNRQMHWDGSEAWIEKTADSNHVRWGEDSQHEKVPEVRFSLGMKFVATSSSESDDDQAPQGGQLSSVTLWTRDAQDVEPLID